MTDWDPATVDTDTAKGTFVQFAAVALAWLICVPFDLCARLGQRSGGDDGDQGADLYGAVEGGQFHNGSNITGAQRDHG